MYFPLRINNSTYCFFFFFFVFVGRSEFCSFTFCFVFFLQEMGLGKTVEVIGCLMSNPWKPETDVSLKPPPPEPTLSGQGVHDLTGPGQVASDEGEERNAPLPSVGGESGELGGSNGARVVWPFGAFFHAIYRLLCRAGRLADSVK